MAVGKLGSLVTTDSKPVGVFTSTDFKTVSVYVNNKNNVSAKYSVGVSTSASTIQDKEYIYNLNPIGPLEVIELTDLYLDSGQTLVVRSSISDVSFSAISVDIGDSIGYGRSDSLLITNATKGINQTLTTPSEDIIYTLGINNQSYDTAKIYVGVADSSGNLNDGWIIFAQTLAPSNSFAISNLYVGNSQSIIVKSDISGVSFSALSKVPKPSNLNAILGAGNTSSLGMSVGVVTSTTFKGPLTGNVTGEINGISLSSNVSGIKVLGIATAASFVGNITGNVIGNVTGNVSGTSGGLTGTPNIDVNNISSVDINASDLNVIGITTSGEFVGVGTRLSGITSVTPGQYGNATAVAQVTVDNSGRISEITNVLISGGGGGGTEIIVFDSGSLVGTAGTINFGDGITVTNVSSGLVTVTAGAASTAEIRSNTLVVSGVSTFSGITTVTGQTLFSKQISATGVVTASSFRGSGANLTSLTGAAAATYGDSGSIPRITVDANGRITGITTSAAAGAGGISAVVDDTTPQLGGNLDLNGNNITGTGQVSITGVCTATGFRSNSTVGDGSDVGFAIKYNITANGTSAYRFAGPGVLNTTDNPTLYLHRGFTYILQNSAGGGHPLELRVSAGGAAYSPGGNFLTGSTSGTQILTVPFSAPSSIVYQCTNHPAMVGTIFFVV